MFTRYENALTHVHRRHGLENPKAYVDGTFGACGYEDCAYTTMRTNDFIKHIKNVHLKVCLFFVETIFVLGTSHLYPSHFLEMHHQ